MRRAKTKARDMALTLKRIARADERMIKDVTADAGLDPKAMSAWPERALPTLTHAMALADTVGYEIVLRRKA